VFRLFEAPTADDVWQQIAESFRQGRFSSGQASRVGVTSEILHAGISVSNPRQRWIPSRQPALNIAFALAEMIWIMRGRNDSTFLNYFNSKLPKYAGYGPTYHGAYGHRLRSVFGFDQLLRAYLALKHNPDSRQVTLQIWNASTDSPDDNGRPVASDIPCNISCLLKVRKGRLEWLQVMRSNDVHRGLPYNLVQFTTLHEVLAGWLEVELGEYHHISDSLHVYDNTAGDIRRSKPVQGASNEDNLALPKDASDMVFTKLERIVEDIISPGTCADSLVHSFGEGLPKPYWNIGLILSAEGARRRGRRDLAEHALEECTNPIYVQLYAAWLKRTMSIA
jgi:thymidylate synthase